jgi:hypothetical protein
MPSDICFSDLQFIIEFVYRGEIDVSENELQVSCYLYGWLVFFFKVRLSGFWCLYLSNLLISTDDRFVVRYIDISI